MLCYDENYFPTDCHSKDQMDSAVRAGILMLSGIPNLKFEVSQYEVEDGKFCRGTKTDKERNWKNYTRDQAKCFMAGLAHHGIHHAVRRFLFERFKTTFFPFIMFMQNTERDRPDSVKMKRPHCFYSDSKPTPETHAMKFSFKKWRWITSEKLDQAYRVERKMFDMADPLSPADIWFFIKCADLKALYYIYAVIGLPFFLIETLIHGLTSDFEENQKMCEVLTHGRWAVKYYKLVHRNWEKVSEKYWSERDEIEYHQFLTYMVRKA